MMTGLERKRQFKADEIKTDELHKIVSGPLFKEVLEIIQDMAGPTSVPSGMEAAAIQGAYYAGANFVIKSLLDMAEYSIVNNAKHEEARPSQRSLQDYIEQVNRFKTPKK